MHYSRGKYLYFLNNSYENIDYVNNRQLLIYATSFRNMIAKILYCSSTHHSMFFDQ